MINLIQGDCLEVMTMIESGSIDMVMADPPYGTTACKWDSIIPLDEMWEQLKRIIKPSGAIVLFGSQPFTTTLIASNMKMFKYCWVWDKANSGSGLHAKRQPLRVTEDICVFYSKPPTYNPEMTKGVMRNKKSYGSKVGGVVGEINPSADKFNDDYYPKNIVTISNASQKGKQHPTQKPVALMEYLIKTYTNENETVLDFTCGSGSTGVAAKSLNRNFTGIELDENYFNIAKDRISTAESV
jgi:site-specific DNA-methyltransferase (adenine-specific)